MARDSTIVIKGDQAYVVKVEIMRDQNGVFKCIVHGASKTDVGKDIGLEAALVDRPATNQVLLDVWNAALPIVRTANNLE